MENKKIVLLAGKGQSTNIVFNSINKKFGVYLAILEEKENTKIFLKRRIKKLGFFTVIGQMFFQIFIAIPLGLLSRKRQSEIINEKVLDITDIPSEKITNVTSVNSKATIELLQDINPDIIVVNGTRIISKKVLSVINCKFINIHAGITPKYRGVHGAYWALVNSDVENSGVTVHFVDEGIDTGNIIDQITVLPTKQDNFSTYPLLQLSEGIKMLNKALENFYEKKLFAKHAKEMQSALWYHPTLWKYIYYRIMRGIK